MKPPYNAMDVANYIVTKAIEQKKPVTHLKLQKLLYYVVAKYLQDVKKPLIHEPILKWQYGPVTSSVYHAFKNYGSHEINQAYTYLTEKPSLMPDENGEFHLDFAKPEQINKELDRNQEFVAVVQEVFDNLLAKDAFDLVEKTHREPAWADYQSQIAVRGANLEYTEDELQCAKL